MSLAFNNTPEYNEGGIVTYENDRESYIYICGVDPTRDIQIDDHVTLMPVKASADPNDMIDCFMKHGNGSEFEMGLLI